MLQRLAIEIAQVKAGNLSEDLLNESFKLYILCFEKMKLLKKSMQQYNTIFMDTLFMNSKNSKTSDPDRLLPNISDKINLKRSDKYVTLSNYSIYT